MVYKQHKSGYSGQTAPLRTIPNIHVYKLFRKITKGRQITNKTR